MAASGRFADPSCYLDRRRYLEKHSSGRIKKLKSRYFQLVSDHIRYFDVSRRASDMNMRPIDNVCPCVQKKGEVSKKEKLRGVIMLEQVKGVAAEDREFTITTLEGDTVLVSPRDRAI